MKKLLFFVLVLFSVNTFAESSYSIKTLELKLPLVKIGDSYFKDVSTKVKPEDFSDVKVTPIKNDISDAKESFNIQIKDFAGLDEGSIFVSSTGIVWKVVSGTIPFKELNPTLNVFLLQDDSYTLQLGSSLAKIEPFIFQDIKQTWLDSFVGLSTKLIFIADGKVWQSKKSLDIPTGSKIVIYNSQFLVYNGLTYKVEQLN